jgi:hypothetical protein
MKPYGSNDKNSNYMYKGKYWCDCFLCIPVKKGSKKSERHKAKKEIKKVLAE